MIAIRMLLSEMDIPAFYWKLFKDIDHYNGVAV